ncbi:MAG: ASCH domain-containing protein [Bacteroidota bacterium]
MKALSIKQPWAWLILHGGKDIENRTWKTKHRGPFLIHTGKGCAKHEYQFAVDFCKERGLPVPPALKDLSRGGIVGQVTLVDCVEDSDSPWYMGEVGFVLKDPEPLDFVPCKGKLNFFEVPL